MEGLAELFENALNDTGKRASKRGAKRKWREIESIKDKYRLRNELKDIDPSADYDLADLEF
ncbi:DUF3545 family protein [Psychrosphaera aestuarii]|uniref:DUF3545 family protein n=1 Tax=Psychrosphaera aestuarii TaxID=1266052 RepID=UPI001B32CBEB|nr:DUF3545 family protein [Psychrosphaera aestuarii]